MTVDAPRPADTGDAFQRTWARVQSTGCALTQTGQASPPGISSIRPRVAIMLFRFS